MIHSRTLLALEPGEVLRRRGTSQSIIEATQIGDSYVVTHAGPRGAHTLYDGPSLFEAVDTLNVRLAQATPDPSTP